MCAVLPACSVLGARAPLASVRGKAVGAVSLAYFCDGPCGRLPDINHPATKGWLLHVLREATEDASAWAVSDGEMWSAEADYLEMDGPWNFPAAATEGEALAAALLAVWGQA